MAQYSSAETLSNASLRTLKYLKQSDENFLIDAKGTRFDLLSPEFIKPLSTIGWLYATLTGVRLPISYIIKKGETVPVDEIKQLIIDDWKKFPRYWQEYEELEDIEKDLATVKTHKDIFYFLSPNYESTNSPNSDP